MLVSVTRILLCGPVGLYGLSKRKPVSSLRRIVVQSNWVRWSEQARFHPKLVLTHLDLR